MNTRIYVMTHKKYNPPIDPMYSSLHVGRVLGEDLGYDGDDTGEQISAKNRSFCELTGIYWIWKNASPDVVGICHYRRFFMDGENLLGKEKIESLLKTYDVIVSDSGRTPYGNLYAHYDTIHHRSDLECCREVLNEKYPDYSDAFELCMHANLFTLGNMMICKKELFDTYCTWLFDILFEVERRIDISSYDTFQKRVFGYLSERLLRVWLLRNSYRVKEIEVRLIENDITDHDLQQETSNEAYCEPQQETSNDVGNEPQQEMPQEIRSEVGKPRILFWQWHSFMGKGIERALNKLEIEYETFFYQLSDWECDDNFQSQLEQKLKEHTYDAVLSVNYNPLISKVCEPLGIRYLSWVYDCPLHIRDESAMQLSCNEIFFFDRIQMTHYQKQSVNAHYLPLAADESVFSESVQVPDYGLRLPKTGAAAVWPGKVSSDIKKDLEVSFVGQLYETEYGHYSMPLDGYLRGYLEGLISAQQQVSGAYLFGETLTDEMLKRLNDCYTKASGGKVHVNRREMEYLLACETTSRERRLLLALLSNHFQVALYSGKQDEHLTKVQQFGYADYYTKMPQIFVRSKINLNISLKAIPSGIPLRVLDIMACGGFLISNFQAEMAEYFAIGDEIVVYENPADLVEKVQFYLSHDEERQRIAGNGKARIETDFSFESRMREILNVLC